MLATIGTRPRVNRSRRVRLGAPLEVLRPSPREALRPRSPPARPGPLARFDRRQVAGVLAAGALGALTGASGAAALASPRPIARVSAGPALGDVGTRSIAFHGDRQAGIVTPAGPQAHACVAAFDLVDGVSRAALADLLRRWSVAAEALTAGRPLGHTDDFVVAGLGPAALTITVGFGPSLFGKARLARSARPDALAPLPPFAGQQLDQARSDGDLGVVVAADDPVVVSHAARVLLAAGRRHGDGPVATAWLQRRTRCGPSDVTGRNLMGQVDGTNNPKPSEPDFAAKVFAQGPAGWRVGHTW